MKRKFRIRLPVQFRDIDVAGHVNHATYLQYMETARVEFLRSVGQIDIFHPRMILASARCEYYWPIIKERRITVTVWSAELATAPGTLTTQYKVRSEYMPKEERLKLLMITRRGRQLGSGES